MPSMKASLKIAKLNYLRKVNEYRVFYCENKIKKRSSTASLINCPFQVKWSMLNHISPHRHDIFYRVKISTVLSTDHTCMMSLISYKHALRKSSGHSKIELNTINTAVSVLKMNPSMPAKPTDIRNWICNPTQDCVLKSVDEKFKKCGHKYSISVGHRK